MSSGDWEREALPRTTRSDPARLPLDQRPTELSVGTLRAAHRAAVDTGARSWGGGTPLVRAGPSACDLAADRRVGVCSLAGTELWAGLGCPHGPSRQPQRGPWWDVCRAPKHSYGLRGHCPGRPGFRRAGHTPSWSGQDLGRRETSDGPVS